MKKIFFVILLFAFNTSAQSQSGWFFQPSGVSFILNKIKFVNSQTGFIIGISKNILKTTNSGQTWNQVYTVDSVTEYRDIFFINQNTGYAAGGVFVLQPEYYFSSTLVKTTNSGNSWFTVLRDTNQFFQMIFGSVYFTSAATGYTGAGLYSNSDNRLYKTIDSGNTWAEISFDQNNGFPFSMYFSDEMNGFTAISYKIIKTTNAGVSWTVYPSPFYPSFLQDLFFTDPNTGYACGGSQYPPGESFIMKTTNSGTNWNIILRKYGSNFYDLNSIYFPTNNIGYSVGSSLLGNNTIDTLSIILKTTDAGINWGFQDSPPVPLRSVYFFNPDTGFAVGMNGTIFKTTDGGGEIISSIKSYENSIPESISLSQNYPNPFNPKTIINYSIPSNVRRQTSDVKLLIYNALGKEVATLVNEKQNAGSYSVEFNGEGLPSGVYFYKLVVSPSNSLVVSPSNSLVVSPSNQLVVSSTNSLESDNFIETKRMVLLK